MRKTYPTDLSDTQWACLRSYLPIRKAQGRPRIHSLRDVLDAIFYVLKRGCHWRLLPTTSLLGLPSTITSGNCALAERGLSFTGPCAAPRGTETARTPIHRQR